MIRLRWNHMQATSLFGLVACLVSCATDDGGLTPARERFAPPRATADWIDSPPARCAVGASGPTLNPRNAIRYSRVSAIESLAAGSLEVEIQTISGVGGARGAFEISAQSLSGTLANARIVALWAETNPYGQGRARVRQVYALACWPDADVSGLPGLDYPRWLIEPPSESGRICATGIAGPTWKKEDQQPSALRDARLAIAVALESRIEKRIFDDGHGVAKMARKIDPSPAALRRSAAADELENEWRDEDGKGPMGLPGLLYGLACIED